ncbi:MAG: L-seryl-tRNA(Sec) selenium transferase [Thermodesulfobacteriota bacterium]
MNKNEMLRSLPKVDEAIGTLVDLIDENTPLKVVKNCVRDEIELEREKILQEQADPQGVSVQQWSERFIAAIKKRMSPNLRRVINGTGVVIHTNLGRSLLSQDTSASLTLAASHYTNLEFNLHTGKRGSRYSLVEEIICDVTGAEAALVVNNNAAAVLLVLDTLAKEKEAIVSRGQLVEIGGSFRIPDVMAKSGAVMVEVGATNRTHLRDYESKINEQTGLLLKVHQSNFRQVGFTAEVSCEDMAALGEKHKVPVMEDLGSGCLVDLSPYGLPKEPTVQEVVKSGIDVVTFSGDKLLGGPQAGIIVGSKPIIDRIKKNPMNRALRIDKFTLASLESVMRSYYDIERALTEVVTLSMLTVKGEVIRKRGQRLMRRIKKSLDGHCSVSLVNTSSRVGGGAMPEYGIDSWALALVPLLISVSRMERLFRELDIPIIGRMEEEMLLLDMRTILDREVAELGDILIRFFLESEGV